MTKKIDAHIHLFEHGYENRSLAERIGVDASEADYYPQLARHRGGGEALVVGYAQLDWCRDNNTYLARLAAERSWVRPTAYVADPVALTVDALEQWRRERFVGISLYVFDDAGYRALASTPDVLWRWLVEHRWLISVNGNAGAWRAWDAVLDRHYDLRVLISHLGLRENLEVATNVDAAAEQLRPVLDLARHPQTRAKLSGFYTLGAATSPAAAGPYIAAAYRAFGAQRLLWGSDFTPHLFFISFDDTIAAIDQADCLDDDARRLVFADNLRQLLDDATTTIP